MLFQDATIVNGMVRTKDAKFSSSEIEEATNKKRELEYTLYKIDENSSQAKRIENEIKLLDKIIYSKDTEDSYNYKGVDYERKELWEKLKQEGKTKKFFTLSAQEKLGRDGQYIIYQAPSGELFAVTRDTNDIGVEKGKRFYVEVDDILDGRKSGSYSNSFDTLSEVRTWVRSIGKKGAKVRIWDNNTNTTSIPTKEMVVDTADIKYNETPDSEFDKDELALGIKTEMEHTDNKEEATSIAKDHLQEMSDYYTKLKKMEAKDAEVNKYRIYWINFNYYSQEEFNNLEDAVNYAKSKSFEYRIDLNGKPIGNGGGLHGFRKY